MLRIILASTSPRRKELFAKLNVPFEVHESGYEEDMTLKLAPRILVKNFAKAKADAVATKFPDAVVVAGDTVIAFRNRAIGKPHTAERAKEMLKHLQGTSHSIFTAYAVMQKSSGKLISGIVEVKIKFRPVSDEEIDVYVATGEPLDKAGAYAIQGGAREFIENIKGDFDAAVGLPVTEIREALKAFGIAAK